MTKPNRDITAEEPTTSTEWERQFDNEFTNPHWGELRTQLHDFIAKLLTTRTNELLGAMEEIIEQDEPYENRNRHNENYYLEENQQINTRNDLRSEQRQQLAILRQKYSV